MKSSLPKLDPEPNVRDFDRGHEYAAVEICFEEKNRPGCFVHHVTLKDIDGTKHLVPPEWSTGCWDWVFLVNHNGVIAPEDYDVDDGVVRARYVGG